MSSDVVVVGAGVVGISIALALQDRGATVTVLERRGIASGQSGIQPGGIRLQFGTAVNCSLARESLTWWKDAVERLPSAVPLGFTACGYLFVAHTQPVLDRLAAIVAVQNEAGVPTRVVSAGEAGRIVPGLGSSSLVGAAWCAEDGYMDEPQAVIEAMARHVISAERHFAAKQLHNGRVLASDLSAAGDPDAGRAGWLANIRAGIAELLPVLSYVDFEVLTSGDYDLTPDRQPMLGPVPGHDGLHVAAGFSGHGFMIAPAVGRIVAGGVLGERDPVLDVLDVERFAQGRPLPEPQVI